MPFSHEHYLALWQEYYTRLQNDADAEWQWRPPRPDDHKSVSPFENAARSDQWNFVPSSLAAARRLEAQQATAEAAKAEAGPPPFVPVEAWTAAQKFRAEKEAQLEAEAEASRVE
jgi:hypothetical protein